MRETWHEEKLWFCSKTFQFVLRARLHQASASSILFSLKTMESLQNEIVTHFSATPLFSIRTVTLASSQSCRSVDANAWCKWALRRIGSKKKQLDLDTYSTEECWLRRLSGTSTSIHQRLGWPGTVWQDSWVQGQMKMQTASCPHLDVAIKRNKYELKSLYNLTSYFSWNCFHITVINGIL